MLVISPVTEAHHTLVCSLLGGWLGRWRGCGGGGFGEGESQGELTQGEDEVFATNTIKEVRHILLCSLVGDWLMKVAGGVGRATGRVGGGGSGRPTDPGRSQGLCH